MKLEEAFGLLNLQDRKKEGQIIARNFSELVIERESKKRKVSEKGQKGISLVWEKHLKSHPTDFDGPLLSMKSIAVKNSKIYLLGRPCRFSEFLVSRKMCQQGKRINFLDIHSSIDYEQPMPISFGMVTKTISTRDEPYGSVIAAIRGNTAFDGKKATFLPGGYINPEVDYDPKSFGRIKKIVLNQAVLRELKEELPGISVWRQPPKFLAIIHSLVDSCQPLIAGWMEIPYTSEEVMRMHRRKTEKEINEIICVPADIESLKEFAKKYTLCIHDVYKIAFFVADTM